MTNPDAPPPTRKPRGQGLARRAEILTAAKRLFVTDGYEYTTIRKIAAAVGLSSASLYVYFQDKDAILRAIAESTFETLLEHLHASQAIDAPPLERFRVGIAAYIAFGLAHPDEYRLTFLSKMMANCTPGPAGQQSPIPAADRSFDVLTTSIAGLSDAGVFRAGDPEILAEAVWASIHGTTAILLDHAETLTSSPGVLISTVTEIVVQGLLKSDS